MLNNPFDTDERRAFRETLRNFMTKEIVPHAFEWDEAGHVPWAVHEKFGALGLWGFGIDEKYGGHGFDDPFMRMDASVEIARCGVGGIGAAIGGRGISLDPIQRLAAEDIRTRVLPEIIAGRKGSSLAITEPSGGSDVARIKTTARQDGDDWILNGSKTFITGGMESDYFVVAARTGGEGLTGISLFFVEPNMPGFSRTELGKKMGWWASNQAALYFDDMRVPGKNLMGQKDYGFIEIMQNFNYERLSLAAIALGMMDAALEDSIAWAQQRETFGKPLIRHQVIRHKIADMSAKIDALRSHLWILCAAIEGGSMPVAELTKVKFLATKSLEFVASEAMQILGGAGYLRGNRVESIYRDVKVIAIGGGSEEIMRDLAVRQMGL
ncbi:acyl-CoA dehydrogenase [Algimonas ampicilliniresistens]|uniref:Acyl-CoA dehydrogenase n=1 Tax=Algimonas ampicilliniresistens TaxID=1298735 RepID=A0ABQ5V6B8_9PROT|nr:acyl-CoA dehydrogenase family protein [Algimonas ampicilliniresistens]GLQ23059.1 acyl-CoA dehydrogenase [Algimonas ampicilliniresistens]